MSGSVFRSNSSNRAKAVFLLLMICALGLLLPGGDAHAGAAIPQAQEETILDDFCDPGTGFLARIVPCLSDVVIGLGFDFTEQIYPVFQDAVIALLVVVVIIYGAKLLYGGVEKIARSTFVLALKIACVLFFSTHLGTYDPFDFDVLSAVLDLLDGLLIAVTDATTLSGSLQCPIIGVNLWERVDCILNVVIGISSPRLLADGMLSFFFYSLFSGAISLVIGLMGLWMVFNLVLGILKVVETYIVTLIALVMIVIMGVMFIPLIFFSALGYFENWVKMIGGVLIKPVIMFAYLNVVLSGFDLVLYSGEYSLFHTFAGVKVDEDGFKIGDYVEDNQLFATKTPGPVMDQSKLPWNTGVVSPMQGIMRYSVQNQDEGATLFDPTQIAQLPLGIPMQGIDWAKAAETRDPPFDPADVGTSEPGKFMEKKMFGSMMVAGLVSYILLLLMNNIDYLANQLSGVAQDVGTNVGIVGGLTSRAGIPNFLTPSGSTAAAMKSMNRLGDGIKSGITSISSGARSMATSSTVARAAGAGAGVGTLAAASGAAASASGGSAGSASAGATVPRPALKPTTVTSGQSGAVSGGSGSTRISGSASADTLGQAPNKLFPDGVRPVQRTSRVAEGPEVIREPMRRADTPVEGAIREPMRRAETAEDFAKAHAENKLFSKAGTGSNLPETGAIREPARQSANLEYTGIREPFPSQATVARNSDVTGVKTGGSGSDNLRGGAGSDTLGETIREPFPSQTPPQYTGIREPFPSQTPPQYTGIREPFPSAQTVASYSDMTGAVPDAFSGGTGSPQLSGSAAADDLWANAPNKLFPDGNRPEQIASLEKTQEELDELAEKEQRQQERLEAEEEERHQQEVAQMEEFAQKTKEEWAARAQEDPEAASPYRGLQPETNTAGNTQTAEANTPDNKDQT